VISSDDDDADEATVPSSITAASNGETMENMHTNAEEGRLTLANALLYADK
jgi:leucyl aminopeptidase